MVFSRLYTHLTSSQLISKPSLVRSPPQEDPGIWPPQQPLSEPPIDDPITLLKLEIQHISALIASDHAAGKTTEYLDSLLGDLVAKMLDEKARMGIMELITSEEWEVTEEEREAWEEYTGKDRDENGERRKVGGGEEQEWEDEGVWWERPWDLDFSDKEDERDVLHGSFTMLQLHERNS